MSNAIKGLYRRAKLFKRIAHSHFTGKRVPIVAHIAITGFCNLRCSYCYGDYSPEKVQEMMRGGPTKEQLFTLIDELDAAAQRFSTTVKIISTETREGVQLRDIGKCAAILRYELQIE